MSRHSRLLAAALFIAAAACSPSDDTDGAASGDTAATAQAPSNGGGDDVADVAAYELTMEKVDRIYEVQRNMAVAMKDMSPAEREQMDLGADAETSMDQIVERMESNPVMNKALDDAGMSAREYMTASLAMVQAGMASAVLEMRPNDNADSLVREMQASMENVEFMRENRAALEQKQQAMEAEMRQMGVLDEE